MSAGRKKVQIFFSLTRFSSDTRGHLPEYPYGQRITDLTGAKITGYDVLPDPHHGTIELITTNTSVTWHRWADQFEIDDTSEVLAQLTDQFYKGACAAFNKRMGKGTIICIGFDQEEGIYKLVEQSLMDELPYLFPLPNHTLFQVRGNLGIFLNYNETAVSIPNEILEHFTPINDSLTIAPAGVSFLIPGAHSLVLELLCIVDYITRL